MSRKKKELPILKNITIEAVAAEGKCLFHWSTGEGEQLRRFVVFVPFCVPGDVVDVKITRKKHSFAEGEVVNLVTPSPLRIEPRCQHFGICGGCKWQNMPYEEQLRFKQQQVYDQLSRIGKIELPDSVDGDSITSTQLGYFPIKGSVKHFEYRNKLDFGCSNKQWLTREQMQQGIPFHPGIGFHITGAFDKVLPIEECHLMDDINNKIRNFIYQYAIEHDITFYDLRAQHGLLRDLVMRNSLSGEFMLVVQFGPTEPIKNSLPKLRACSPEHPLERKSGRAGVGLAVAEEVASMSKFDNDTAMSVLEAIHQQFTEITSLLWVYNPKCNDTFGDLEVHTYYGTDFIYELMEDLRFKVGPKSFYQTNTEQALHLYEVTRSFAFSPKVGESEAKLMRGFDPLISLSSQKLEKRPVVYDLYTGTGTIANFVAKRAKKVIGIEYVPEAIEDAKVNSEINGIENTEFYAGDMKDILTDEFIAEHGRPDTIITDPPRAGMHPDVIKVIMNAHPQRIVYVSCNPATQARDLQLLDPDYKVIAVQPVDMFPHTPHVENVVLLEARSNG